MKNDLNSVTSADSASARIRAQLDHPVMDSDGHWVEPFPVFLDYLAQEASPKLVDEFISIEQRFIHWYEMSAEERIRVRMPRPHYWFFPGNSADRATSMIPRLLHNRLDQFGIDFAVIYPTLGLLASSRPDSSDLSEAACRAVHKMTADLFRPHTNRLAPVAMIPLRTPEEAIRHVEHAVKELGFKAIGFGSLPIRQIEGAAKSDRFGSYIDNLGVDSPYDYDPLWAKLSELKVAATFHGAAHGWPDRRTVSTWVCNHIGHFAQAGATVARGLFLGGVSQRFPNLNFGFLEGGAAWGASLCLDLEGHWEKYNRNAMHKNQKPTNIDRAELKRLFDTFATDDVYKGKLKELVETETSFPFLRGDPEKVAARDEDSNEFRTVKLNSARECRELYSRSFFFGCEADDPSVAWSVDKRMGLKLKTMFSSDVSHFDVPDMSAVVEEAWELVEDGLLDKDQFRNFMFGNVVRLHGKNNPEFFKGTVLEQEAMAELQKAS